MCGLTGLWEPQVGATQEPILTAMTEAIRHRGPDDFGYWWDAPQGLGLGHRRLSILDLSAHGHQPMVGASGRYVIAYNGEVYNFAEMRRTLRAEGFSFRGGSDTEVLLAALEHFGVEAALNMFVGMFAFALYDRLERRLTLARDRLGIKPLYYALAEGRLIFGSELKSLLAHPRVPRALDTTSLHQFLRLGYVPAPGSIYRDIHKLPQGHLVVFALENGVVVQKESTPYWRLDRLVHEARATPPPGDEAAWLKGFQTRLDRAVADRLVADVPLGAFLSGGIDSSLVVATMQRLAPGKVKTFSIGFKDGAYNEATHAREIADHLGTDHHELYLEERQLLELVPRLPEIWCEPFGDSSQLPTLLLAQFARQEVTVALSGDGGDELAGGYVRHMNAARLRRLNQRLPLPLRRLAAGLLRAVPMNAWDRIYGAAAPLLPKNTRIRLPGDKLHKLARALGASDEAALYREVVSLDTVGDLLRPEFVPPDPLFPWPLPDLPLTAAEDFMIRDSYRYLPDDVLTKVDRATMAVALEARVPLLDHRLWAYVWGLPESIKIRGGVGKYLLRTALAAEVPQALWDRPKMGFAAPVGPWLRGPLRPWAASLLAGVADLPWFDPAKVNRLWRQHQAGKGNTTAQLWHLLMFLAWQAHNHKG